MEKFIAEKPDLTLELITLSGEELVLEPIKPVSGKVALEITKKWTALEKKQKEDDEISALDIVAVELSYIYPKEAAWFLDNFDFGVLNQILTYVAQTIGGIKKKSKK